MSKGKYKTIDFAGNKAVLKSAVRICFRSEVSLSESVLSEGIKNEL